MVKRLQRKADLKFGPFSLWVHGRESEDASDFDDGNWLRVTARCSESGAQVEVTGPILHAPELKEWSSQLRRLHRTLEGEAVLDPMEPNLSIRVAASSPGRVDVEVRITPDNVNQEHVFRSELDQSYLPGVLASLESIAQRFPVKGSPFR